MVKAGAKHRVEKKSRVYKLYQDTGVMREKVYVGVSDDVERRTPEHRRSGKKFNHVKVSRPMSRARALEVETEEIRSHQRNDIFGEGPKYNIRKVRKHRSSFGNYEDDYDSEVEDRAIDYDDCNDPFDVDLPGRDDDGGFDPFDYEPPGLRDSGDPFDLDFDL